MKIEDCDPQDLPAGSVVLVWTPDKGEDPEPEASAVLEDAFDSRGYVTTDALEQVGAFLLEENRRGEGRLYRIDTDPEDEQGATTPLYRFHRGAWAVEG